MSTTDSINSIAWVSVDLRLSTVRRQMKAGIGVIDGANPAVYPAKLLLTSGTVFVINAFFWVHSVC
ncbi:MAG: hypothetical protein KME49_18980 [Brasilonema octagenarum HA4186-MV1]|uniref:hypothetical protein n=1 Tax=Brasilonema TaxID=383614 RepID=UPI00145C9994|nr:MULTISPECIES: hypothetical protein [Brasilonema]MBW4627525.1 hypothetical protein [Brasilonema octagenarum HA4186-MV1]